MLIDSKMIQLRCRVKQLKIGKTIHLHSFVLNYIKYANIEGFCRDSHKSYTPWHACPYRIISCNDLDVTAVQSFSQLILYSNPELTNIHHPFQMTCTDKTGMVERDDEPTERVKSKKTRHNYS